MNRRRFILAAAVVVMFARGGTADADDAVRISLRVAGGKLVEGPRAIRLKRNATVVLTVRADTTDELHVHGYNLQLKLSPNQPGTLSFVAKRTGRFTYELHEAGTELGAFEVYPD
jgi:hypothetical protein